MTRTIAWKDVSDPYPRAGLWYVSHEGTLYECWAETAEAADKGPSDIFDYDFRCVAIGKTRRNLKD